MKRVISVLVGVVIAVVFGQAPTSAATLVTTAPATHVAAHDGHGNAAALTGTVTERGSPAPYGGDHLDVADRCSHGGSAHPEGVAPGAISTYDDHATLVRSRSLRARPGSNCGGLTMNFSSTDRDWVAAKGASEVANEGIYVVRSSKGVYVGQSGNISGRLGRHVADDKFTQAEIDAAERILVRGGKTQREIAEQLKLDSFGGRDADGVVNLVNPIGDRRLSLMPEGYVRP